MISEKEDTSYTCLTVDVTPWPSCRCVRPHSPVSNRSTHQLHPAGHHLVRKDARTRAVASRATSMPAVCPRKASLCEQATSQSVSRQQYGQASTQRG